MMREQTIDPAPSHPWFALRVRARAEKVVAAALRARGYEEFLPLYRERRRWSDRVAEVQLPLFPGYVFARFEVERRLPVLQVSGVVDVVGIGRTPHPIDDVEMASLRATVDTGQRVEPWTTECVGQRVRILAGPFRDVEGVVVDVRSRRRLVVTLSLLQRSVSVEIDSDHAWPSEPAALLRAS